jgi:hypothetical protein
MEPPVDLHERREHKVVMHVERLLEAYGRELEELEHPKYRAGAFRTLVTLAARRPREAVLGASTLLGGTTLLALILGKIIDRLIVAPDYGLALLVVTITGGGMALLARPRANS